LKKNNEIIEYIFLNPTPLLQSNMKTKQPNNRMFQHENKILSARQDFEIVHTAKAGLDGDFYIRFAQ